MTIRSFNDKQTARELGREVEAALQHIASKHGVSIRYNGGQLDANSFAMKLKIDILAQTTVGSTPAGTPIQTNMTAGLANQCRALNLDPGRPNIKRYTLVDYSPARWKYPFTVKGPEGGRYKITEAQAIRYFARPVAEIPSGEPAAMAAPTPDNRYAARF